MRPVGVQVVTGPVRTRDSVSSSPPLPFALSAVGAWAKCRAPAPGNESMKTNRSRGRAGQSLVEMAMVLPVLAFLTFGLLDFGRAYYFQVSVTNSAREGARVGILNIYTGPQNPSCSISNSYATCPVQTDANIVTAASKELIYSGIAPQDRKSTRLNSSHTVTSYAVFC